MKGNIDTLKITVVLTGTVSERQLVAFGGAAAGLNAAVIGPAAMDGVTGDAVAVTALGVVDLTAGAAIAVGDELISDAAGKPIPKGATTNPPTSLAARSTQPPSARVSPSSSAKEPRHDRP